MNACPTLLNRSNFDIFLSLLYLLSVPLILFVLKITVKSGKYNTFNSEYVGDKNLKNCSAFCWFFWFLIVKYYCELLSNIRWNKKMLCIQKDYSLSDTAEVHCSLNQNTISNLLVNFCSTWMKIQRENGHEICMRWKKNDNKTVE